MVFLFYHTLKYIWCKAEVSVMWCFRRLYNILIYYQMLEMVLNIYFITRDAFFWIFWLLKICFKKVFTITFYIFNTSLLNIPVFFCRSNKCRLEHNKKLLSKTLKIVIGPDFSPVGYCMMSWVPSCKSMAQLNVIDNWWSNFWVW